MTTHEQILTVQLGSFSNFIGSHFWNQQQEQLNRAVASGNALDINTASVFSEHLSPGTRRVQYRPHLLLADISGALGGNVENGDALNGLSSSKEPCAQPHNVSATNHIEVPVSSKFVSFRPSLPAHPYIRYLNSQASSTATSAAKVPDLDFVSTVRHFTDFFIPEWDTSKQVELLPGLTGGEHGASFCNVWAGETLTSADHQGSFWNNFTDKLRLQLEEIDQLAVLQLSVDWLTGFSAVASETLCWLKEEALKTTFVIFGWQPSESKQNADSPQHWLQRRVGGGLFLQTCYEELSHNKSSAFVFTDYHGDAHASVRPYHSESPFLASALPALALDSATAPYRLSGISSSAAAGRLFQAMSQTSLSPFATCYFGTVFPTDESKTSADASLHFSSTQRNPHPNALLDLTSCLWDIRVAPSEYTHLTSALPPSNHKSLRDLEQSDVPFYYSSVLTSRGIAPKEGDWWSAALQSRYRCLQHAAPLAVPFPSQVFGNPSTAYVPDSIPTLACWASDRTPWLTPSLNRVHRAVAQSLHMNYLPVVESRCDRERLVGLNGLLRDVMDPEGGYDDDE